MNELVPPYDIPFPPWLARLLPDLSNAALRVALVVLAETAGWEAESAILSRADFAALSGLAPSSVQSGIEDALNLQLLQRAPSGMSYAYRLKAPSDSSEFPATPSRNVTALRQLQRLQLRLAEQLEFERMVLERGLRQSFKAADSAPVNGDDRKAVSRTEPTTTSPARKTSPLPLPSHEVDRAPVRLPDQLVTNPRDCNWAAVTLDPLDQTAVKGADGNAVKVDRKAVKPLVQERSSDRPMTISAVDRQPTNRPVTSCEQVVSSSPRAPIRARVRRKNINNLLTLKHTDTVWGNCNSTCVRAREATHLSVFSYSEVLAYTESLKGIRNPGGLAVVYWRSGEMDAEIANFQLRQAKRAERLAAEEAEREAEMRASARELLARGEPFAEWEREFIAAFAAEIQEEHDVQIQWMDAQHNNLV